VAYPDDPATLSDEQWAHYVFFRDNTKGRFAERWNHSHGCRRWFNAVRDTTTYRFERVYRLDEPKPVISMSELASESMSQRLREAPTERSEGVR
jgi:sarcosine oxidase subunit delta